MHCVRNKILKIQLLSPLFLDILLDLQAFRFFKKSEGESKARPTLHLVHA